MRGRLRRENHQSLLRFNQVPVFHQRIELGFTDLNVDQLLSGDAQGNDFTSRHCHGPLTGNNHALIANLGGEHGHILAQQFALVDDGTFRTVTGELVLACQEILVADSQRAGHQTTHINPRTLTKQHAIGVYYKNLTIGIQVAENLGSATAGDPVQGRGIAIGLAEIHRGIRADVETLPVDDALLSGLVDIHGVVGLGYAHLTGNDLAVRRKLIVCRRCREGRGRQHTANNGTQSAFPGVLALASSCGHF